ncbi:MAG: SOS response-associated peptidase [Pseudolysinimonas sp.]|uniref:SOS response-associated peptidase n=1 Tax=Pseudolysinimonas sp. TaxID=2680009 RepID=UPI003263D089
MCGRYAMDDTTNELVVEFVAAGGRAQDWIPNYNVAPTQRAPIVREFVDDAGTLEREIELAQWGFWPAWVKAGDKRPHPINARFETVASNGMFRGAFAERRCIVPMRGYYEWVAQPDGKQPHFIHDVDGELLSAAGIYAVRKDDAGEWQVTYAVITREARDASGEIHDRMPLFLTPDMRDEWLQPAKAGDVDSLMHNLDRASSAIAKAIVTYPVSRAVNNVRTADATDPALIEPLQAADTSPA